MTIQSGDFSDLRNLVDPDLCNQDVNAQADYQQIDEDETDDHYYDDDYKYYDYDHNYNYDYYYYYFYYNYDNDNCDYIRAYKNAFEYPLSTVAKGAYNDLDQLYALTLRGNGIIYVSPGAFINLQNLRNLDLSYNEIAYLLPDTFVNVPRLRFLYLHGNKLTALPPELFGTLPRLGKVTLHNNPWTCDCWLQGLVQWMKTTGVTYESQFPVKCTSSPVPSLLNVSLARVDPQSLICEQTTTPQITASSETSTTPEENTIPSPTKKTAVTVTPRLVPPRAVALVTTTTTESIVQWESPSDGVMGFIISYVKTNGGRMQMTQPIEPSVKVYRLQKLSPGTTYHVCVIAQYPVGRSAVTNDTCVTAATKDSDQTLVIALAAVGVIAAVFMVGTIVMCKLRRMQRSTPSSTPQTAQNIQMQSAVPPPTTHVVPPDNGVDTSAGGPTPTPDDNFYMHLVNPVAQGGDVTNSAAASTPGESGAAPLDNGLDMTSGGATPATPEDHFYMHLVNPAVQECGVTTPAATSTPGESGTAPPDNGLDMAAGGATPTAPDDHFYMYLRNPAPQGGVVTNQAATLTPGESGAAPPDNGLDMAAGGPTLTTPDDHFYMDLRNPDPEGATTPAVAQDRQSEAVYEDVDETWQRRGGSVEDHIYQNDRM